MSKFEQTYTEKYTDPVHLDGDALDDPTLAQLATCDKIQEYADTGLEGRTEYLEATGQLDSKWTLPQALGVVVQTCAEQYTDVDLYEEALYECADVLMTIPTGKLYTWEAVVQEVDERIAEYTGESLAYTTDLEYTENLLCVLADMLHYLCTCECVPLTPEELEALDRCADALLDMAYPY